MMAMACCEGVRRQAPTNFIFLGLFTLAESFLLGVIAVQASPESVCHLHTVARISNAFHMINCLSFR